MSATVIEAESRKACRKCGDFTTALLGMLALSLGTQYHAGQIQKVMEQDVVAAFSSFPQPQVSRNQQSGGVITPPLGSQTSPVSINDGTQTGTHLTDAGLFGRFHNIGRGR